MEDLVRLAAKHKAASVKFNPIMATGRGITMHERGEAFDLKEYLESILGMKVDLVTVGALKPQLKDNILQEVVYL